VSLPLGDVDAPMKLTLDSLKEAGVLDDDVRIVEVRARKFIDKLNPRIEMRVRPCEPDDLRSEGFVEPHK
jgi:Holliday junction resolvase RusA-like endonuclease